MAPEPDHRGAGFTLDRRTRRESDVREIGPAELFSEVVPALTARHGQPAARAASALHAPALTVSTAGGTWSLVPDADAICVEHGTVADAVVVELDPVQFSDWAQLKRSLAGLQVLAGLTPRSGTDRDLSVWDSLWLTLNEGWPTVDDSLAFRDRNGDVLDLGTSFTIDDDPADVAHFLREAGYLHLRGWIDPADMARISAEMDDAVQHYSHGDGQSWWAEMDDGTMRAVRLQGFVRHSPTTAAVLGSDRWEQLRVTLQREDELVMARPGDHVVEALIKPPGVVRGISDVSFHRDCHLGGHPYGCAGVDIGWAVTGSSAATGRLRVVAGSHRVAMPVAMALEDPYLPVVSVWTEPGDLTVHLSCTLHESTPPVSSGRKVMYSPFRLVRPDDRPPTADAGRARNDIAERLLLETAPSSRAAWSARQAGST